MGWKGETRQNMGCMLEGFSKGKGEERDWKGWGGGGILKTWR